MNLNHINVNTVTVLKKTAARPHNLANNLGFKWGLSFHFDQLIYFSHSRSTVYLINSVSFHPMRFFSLEKRFWVRSYIFSAACLNITITNNWDLFMILAFLNIWNFAIQTNRAWSATVTPIRNALHCFIYKYFNSINSLTICQTGSSSLQIKALT